MTNSRQAALQYAQTNQQRFLDQLIEFATIASISTDPSRKNDMHKAATWVAGRLRALGIKHVEVMPTQGHPVVYGEYLHAGNSLPTVLIYGHYDVQPPDPLEEWLSDPFQPTLRGEDLFGRGVSDMKGQVTAGLNAIESIVRTGQLPVNVKFLIEGEEEIGSPNLASFIAAHKDTLTSDFALNLDSSIIKADTPSITYALRGIAYFELRIFGPMQDLHSGTFGGVVHNPAQVLCELVAGMHDKQGRITLPGYYDKVRPLDEMERRELARLPVEDGYYLKMTGAPALFGEAGYTPVERVGARPTLEVNGLLSGYTGEGSKTVLPAKAMAKISMRLVPDQDPEEVYQQLVKYLEERAPKTVRWEITKMAASPASIADRDMPGVVALQQAMQTVWGKSPVFKREGGSVPVVAQMQEILGIKSIICGFGLPDDNLHAPNEKQNLPTWYRGIETLIHFLYNLAG
ncbi:MAG: dipeptidase [Anaerolineales bacterium]|nr:dipeptidase [Anaerolineales bacterium]